jgi:hypothetical protein
MRYEISSNVLSAGLEGEAVLLDMDSKNYFRLNSTGAAVWSELERGKSQEEILATLNATFDGDPTLIATELEELLQTLLARKLVLPLAE